MIGRLALRQFSCKVGLIFFSVVALLGALSAEGQVNPSDGVTLQAILAELRGLHNDVRLTAVSQILLTELQTQPTVVNQATERVSNTRLQFSNLQADEKRVTADLSRAEDALSAAADPPEKTATAQEADRLRAGFAGLKAREEGLETNLQEAEVQLRAARIRWTAFRRIWTRP